MKLAILPANVKSIFNTHVPCLEGESQRLTGTVRRATRQTRYATGWTRARAWSCGCASQGSSPAASAASTPNSIFVTEKRVIIRSPVTFGLAEHIEEYFYDQITNVRLEKGVMSASLIFYIPGMTELSKGGRQFLWRKDDRGTIDAIPKKDAERIYDYVRGKIREAKEAPEKRQEAAEKPKGAADPLAIARERYARGEITREEFMTLSEDLAGQGS